MIRTKLPPELIFVDEIPGQRVSLEVVGRTVRYAGKDKEGYHIMESVERFRVIKKKRGKPV